MPTVNVQYFAILRERAGQATESVSTSAHTVGELYAELAARHRFPDLSRVRAAVNAEFRDWSTPLADGDLVVFIPPVAGG
jgi:molybdopterin converting factor subunit 1